METISDWVLYGLENCIEFSVNLPPKPLILTSHQLHVSDFFFTSLNEITLETSWKSRVLQGYELRIYLSVHQLEFFNTNTNTQIICKKPNK